MNWWNQIDRSGRAILLNIAESYGRSGGTSYYYRIAFAEAFETFAVLLVGPLADEDVEKLSEYLLPLVNLMRAELLKEITRELSEQHEYYSERAKAKANPFEL